MSGHTPKLLTLAVAPRRRAAARMRRLRVACGFSSQEAFAQYASTRGVRVSARSYGAIERGDVAMLALELHELLVERLSELGAANDNQSEAA